MSVAAIAWAFAQPIERSSLKFLLVALADHAGANGIVYPSIETLAKKTALDRKTIMAGITSLLQAGYLGDTSERRGRTGRVRVYQLPVEQEATEQTQKRNSSENGIVPFFPSNSPKNGTVNSPKNGTQNLKKEPSGNREPDLVLHESLPKGEWDEWLAFRRERRFPMTRLSLRKQLAELAKFDTETQRRMIAASINSGWQGIFALKGNEKPKEARWV